MKFTGKFKIIASALGLIASLGLVGACTSASATGTRSAAVAVSTLDLVCPAVANPVAGQTITCTYRAVDSPPSTTDPSTTDATTTKTTPSTPPPPPGQVYPLHTNVPITTFWVGEIFDPNAEDGSQMLSTYDAKWFEHFGGCDGVQSGSKCSVEKRTAANDYFPTKMTPKENPFYVTVPFDDLNNSAAFRDRCTVVPWAADKSRCGDHDYSYMKNRWVKITKGSAVCYGQVEDAGPGQYNDRGYVFGSTDARPQNKRYGGAGMDVSPALNGCLGFADPDGVDKADWRFVDDSAVPAGPWKKIVTTSKVTN